MTTLVVYLVCGALWWAWCTSVLWRDGDVVGAARALYVLPIWPVDLALVVARKLSGR